MTGSSEVTAGSHRNSAAVMTSRGLSTDKTCFYSSSSSSLFMKQVSWTFNLTVSRTISKHFPYIHVVIPTKHYYSGSVKGTRSIADLTGDAGYSGSGQVKPCSLSLGAAGNWDPLNESNQLVIFFTQGKQLSNIKVHKHDCWKISGRTLSFLLFLWMILTRLGAEVSPQTKHLRATNQALTPSHISEILKRY